MVEVCQHLNLKMWTNSPVIEVNRGNIIHVIVVNLQLPNSDVDAVTNQCQTPTTYDEYCFQTTKHIDKYVCVFKRRENFESKCLSKS